MKPEEIRSLFQECEPESSGVSPDKELLEDSSVQTPYSVEFKAWYQAYPLHRSKAKAAEKYEVSVHRIARERSISIEAARNILLIAAKLYAVETQGTEPRFIKHPSTWLNQCCWEDTEVGAAPAETSRPHHPMRSNRALLT